MLLYIIRHGLPDYANDSLTPDGKDQAAALAKRLLKSKIDEVYCSPRGRAIQTAQPFCDVTGITPKILDFVDEDLAYDRFTLTENGYKIWAFCKANILLGTDDCYTDISDFGKGYYNDTLAKEGFEIISKGSDAFLESLGYQKTGIGNGYKVLKESGKKVAVFCHLGAGLHWLAYLLNIPLHIFTSSFCLSQSAVTVLNFYAQGDDGIAYPKCLCLSDLSHIYAEDLPMKYNDLVEI